MTDLKKLIGKKDSFVITSNGECHFELCGFAPEKIYEVEGNWLTMQCASRCHEKVYPWADTRSRVKRSRKEKFPRTAPTLSGLRRTHAGPYGDGREFYP